MKRTDRAYIAGFFDGEGHVCITRHTVSTNTFQCRMGFTNTDRLLLEWIKSRLCGEIFVKNKIRKSQHAEAYQLVITKRSDLIKALKTIRHYVKLKRAQIDLALDFLTHSEKKKYRKLNSKEALFREQTKLRMNFLNARGPRKEVLSGVNTVCQKNWKRS